MRTYYFYVFIFIFISLQSCSTLKPLQMNGVDDVNFKYLQAEPNVQMQLNMYNPNFFGVTLKSMQLQCIVNGNALGIFQVEDKVHVKKKSDFIIPIEVATSYSQLATFLKPGFDDSFSNNQIPFALQGEITLTKFCIFRKTFLLNSSDLFEQK